MGSIEEKKRNYFSQNGFVYTKKKNKVISHCERLIDFHGHFRSTESSSLRPRNLYVKLHRYLSEISTRCVATLSLSLSRV
jgi:hypothetical protein